MSLRAGAAVADITPPAGVLLDGYGGRTQSSQGVHDLLGAHALVLDYGSARETCAIVSCDLLGMHQEVVTAIRSRAHAEAGIPQGNVLVCATHSHAGPHGLRGGMFSNLNDDLASGLIDAVTTAIAEAHAARSPASLKVATAHVDTVSMNRRHPDWPIDPALRVLLIDGEASPIATLLNFACHATVMSGANLMLSAEFPGVAARLLREQTGAPCIYLNGACGNVNPVWIRQDFDSVERVGQVIGGQALRLIGELRTIGPGQRAHNIRWDEFPEKPVAGRLVTPRFKAVRREFDLPLRSFAADEEYASRTAALESDLAPLEAGSHERREVMAQLTRARNERWAAAWARRQGEPGMQRTEIQAMILGDGLGLLALPGEFFVETAGAIREAADVNDLFVACYANDYVGYVVPADAYEKGGYESGVTFCPPEAEGMVVKNAIAALQEAGA